MHGKEKQFKQVNRQFLNYVLPSVVSMLVSSFYIILDGIFVGQGIGEVALAAVNIVFPYMFLVMALALLVSIGGANVYSFLRGEGEPDKANNIFCQCLSILIVIGIVLGLLGTVFRDQAARFLGANDELLPYASVFLKWFGPFVMVQTIVAGLGIFVRNDGAPKLVMLSTVVGSALNVLLEFIFIILMHKGIEFTAIANGISVAIQLTFYSWYFVCKKGSLRLHKPVFYARDLLRIAANGLSTFLMEFSQSTIAFSFNLAFIHTVGTLGVSAYSIVTYAGSVVYSVLIGVTQGAQPIMSFNHGNGDDRIVYHGYMLGVRSNLAAAVLYIGACYAFGTWLVSMFSSGNGDLTGLTVRMLRIIPLSYLPIGVTLMNILFFQTTERNAYSTLVSLLRCVGFVQVLLVFFVPLTGTPGIYIALLAGETCNAALSFLLVRKSLRTMLPAAS